MKTSVRTSATLGSSANLIEDLMRFSGDRLILSAGYLYCFEALPFNTILSSVCNIDLVVGTWTGQTAKETKDSRKLLEDNIEKFAARVARESDEFGIQKPNINAYLVPKWHAKVALMVDTSKDSVSAAVIGSSNISGAALGPFVQTSNVEADVLISSEDGKDAPMELNLLLQHLKPTFAGWPFKSY